MFQFCQKYCTVSLFLRNDDRDITSNWLLCFLVALWKLITGMSLFALPSHFCTKYMWLTNELFWVFTTFVRRLKSVKIMNLKKLRLITTMFVTGLRGWTRVSVNFLQMLKEKMQHSRSTDRKTKKKYHVIFSKNFLQYMGSIYNQRKYSYHQSL